ncbi:hypothetical protein [Alteripontixanthobacter maritimus]|nr:hypothetical protein [Alteripontixanthobacter maritimus]
MTIGNDSSRDERLAAKLRENLKRRKTQARQMERDAQQSKLPKPASES